MLPTLGAVKADQLSDATPCTDWTVANLITHNIRVADFVHGTLQGNNTTDPMNVADSLAGPGARDAFAAGTGRVLDVLKSTSDLDQVIETPFGAMPISSFLMFPTLDIIIHKWDLAKGSGQSTDLDAGLSEACFGALQAGGAEMGRNMGIFAAEVDVPMSATIQDKLLAISGRQP